MSMTDPIADFLTQIRNGIHARHKRVDVPGSRVKVELARILLENQFIAQYRILANGPKRTLRVYLKYTSEEMPAIQGLRRISTPGLRVYARKDRLPLIQGGMGIAILSTSSGLLTDSQCRKRGLGGEVIAHVW